MTGISVEVMPDSGAPHVGVTVDGLAVGSPSVVSVEWSTDGVSWSPVRGAQRVSVIEAGFWRDLLCPLSVLVTYRLVVHSGSVIPDTLTAAITVPSATGWVQDPLSPRRAVALSMSSMGDGEVLLTSASLAEATHTQPADWVTPMGATLPVAAVGGRSMLADFSLGLAYHVASDAGALRSLLTGAGVLVLRGVSSPMLPPVVHVVASSVSEGVLGAGAGQVSVWSLSVSQVAPPSARIVVPWWTYEQVAALWPGSSYAVVMAARPGASYLDFLRDPTPGG